MSIITATLTNEYFYKNSNFDLLVESNVRFTNIDISFFTEYLTTSSIPQTLFILKNRLPSILRSKCFNEYNLPFRKEVKNTEFGHLFEHILLEYICESKRGKGILTPLHNGVTKWDWYRERKGLFHVTIDVGNIDEEFLNLALYKTIKLMEDILLTISADKVIHLIPDTYSTPVLELQIGKT